MKKKWYKIEGRVEIEVKTFVRAKSEKKAEEIAMNREIDICVHGTDDFEATEDWRFVDAPDYVTNIQTIEKTKKP